MKLILDTIEFLHSIRSQMRFGKFSRLPIRLHRFEITDGSAECDWYMRPPDPWNVHLSQRLREEHLTEQALLDALKIRELIFQGFPKVRRAALRMYREQEGGTPELLMTGDIECEISGFRNVSSLNMRARLCGFRFSLTDGILEPIVPN